MNGAALDHTSWYSPRPATGSTRTAAASAAAAAAPPRVALLSLPNEILAQVFADLHARYQHRKTGMPPTQYLRICKRLYAIARPMWFSVLVVPEAETDEYCIKLLEHAAVLAHIRDLQLQLEANPPAWKLALFPHLTGLKTLRLRKTTAKDNDESAYSRRARAAVESLTTLSALHLLSSTTYFIRTSPRPWIRKMDLPISSQMLFGCGSLEQLTLRIDIDTETTDRDYRWDNLKALEFIVDPQLSSTPELFLRKLLIQVRIASPWRGRKKHLTFGLVTRLVTSRSSTCCSVSRSLSRRRIQPTVTFARVSLLAFLGRQSASSSLTMDPTPQSPFQVKFCGRP